MAAVYSVQYVCVAGPPGKVGGLELMYHSEQELRLQWSRPGDFPSDILITYHINITNTSSGAVTQVGHDLTRDSQIHCIEDYLSYQLYSV